MHGACTDRSFDPTYLPALPLLLLPPLSSISSLHDTRIYTAMPERESWAHAALAARMGGWARSNRSTYGALDQSRGAIGYVSVERRRVHRRAYRRAYRRARRCARVVVRVSLCACRCARVVVRVVVARTDTAHVVTGALHPPSPPHEPVVSTGSQAGSSPPRTRRDHANVTIGPCAPADAACVAQQ